jgi:hypothetical protein
MSAQQLLVPSIVSKETLMILENNLVAASRVNRQFENQFVKIGSQLTIRKPNRFKVASGASLQVQDVIEPSTVITINSQKHVDFQFTSQDLTLVVEEFKERYSKPIAAEIANAVDYDVISNFTSVFNEVGTLNTVPNAFSFLANVGQRMDEEAAPQEGRTLLLGPAAYWTMADALKGVFVTSVAESALKGALVNIANFEIFMDQNIQSQTTGAYAGSGWTASAGQTGSNLLTSNWTASITGLLNIGDVITIAGVYAVNPKNRQTTGSLRNFVVTGTVNSDTNGNATIPIYPAIAPFGSSVLGDPYQTVDSSPLNHAAITVISGATGTTHAKNLGFVKDAFGLVMVPLEMPQGADFTARDMYKNISLRVWRDRDIQNDTFPCRIDVLYGTTTFYPELACRLTN